jgi:hypothetical protein
MPQVLNASQKSAHGERAPSPRGNTPGHGGQSSPATVGSSRIAEARQSSDLLRPASPALIESIRTSCGSFLPAVSPRYLLLRAIPKPFPHVCPLALWRYGRPASYRPRVETSVRRRPFYHKADPVARASPACAGAGSVRETLWHRHPADDSWAGSPCHEKASCQNGTANVANARGLGHGTPGEDPS